jgi:hypothetical protein
MIDDDHFDDDDQGAKVSLPEDDTNAFSLDGTLFGATNSPRLLSASSVGSSTQHSAGKSSGALSARLIGNKAAKLKH